MSGTLPPLVLPIRVEGDVTGGVQQAARQAAAQFKAITDAFGGKEFEQAYNRLRRERRQAYNEEKKQQRAKQRRADELAARRIRNASWEVKTAKKLAAQEDARIRRQEAAEARAARQRQREQDRALNSSMKYLTRRSNMREKEARREQKQEDDANRTMNRYAKEEFRWGLKQQTAEQRAAAQAHSIAVAEHKAAARGAASLQDRKRALASLVDLQRRAAQDPALSESARAAAARGAHSAEGERLATLYKIRDEEARLARKRERDADKAARSDLARRKAFARALERINRRGGGVVKSAAQGVASVGAGAAKLGASLPMVPVSAARSFASYMEQAASHSKTIIGSLRDFAGKLYLVERFGFMMNVAGQAIATPFKAALQNSALMEEQTMGIAVHLGAYARDQQLNFQQLFDKSKNATMWLREQAAMLPGEAEDYIEVLRQSTAQQAAAGVSNLTDILENSKNVGIVALLNGIDIQQGGRDYARMLEGRASQRERLFNVLRPKMRNKDGSQMTAEQFNKLGAQQREQKIQGALKPYLKFIAEYEKTFGAQAGALKSNIRIAAERGFRPFFEYFVGGMKKVNQWMVANMDKIAAIGQRVSSKLVGIFGAVGGGAKSAWTGSVAPWMQQQMGNVGAARRVASWQGLVGGGAAGTIGSQVRGAAGSDANLTTKIGQILVPIQAFARAINGFTGLLGVAAGPLRVLGTVFSNVANTISLGVGFFEGMTKDVFQFSQVVQGARGLWANLMVVGGKVADVFRAVGAGVGDVFAGLLADVLPKVSSSMGVLATGLDTAIVWVKRFFEAVKPVVLGVGDFVYKAVTKLWAIVKPQFEAFANWFGGESTSVTDGLLNVSAFVIDALGEVAYAAMMAANMIISAAVGIGRMFGLTSSAGPNIQAEARTASILARAGATGELPEYAQVRGGKFVNSPMLAGGAAVSVVQALFGGSAKTGYDPAVVSKVRDAVNVARKEAHAETGFPMGPAYDAAFKAALQRESERYALSQQIVQKESDPFFRSSTMEAVRNGGDTLRNAVKKRQAEEKVAGMWKVGPWGLGAIPEDTLAPGSRDLLMGDSKAATPSERGGNNFDFRGSRFTIEQKFAEGFDPDRIAVLSTEQISALAVRKTGSTLAPLSWQY